MLIHNTRRGNYNGIIRGVIAAAILFIILTIGTVREGITRALFAVAAPAWRAEQEASGEVGGWLSFFRSRNALVAAYAALEEKNRALTAELFAVSVFKKENEELNEVLARRQFALPFLVARVLVHPGRSPYNTLIIDRGEKDGIKTGAIATLYGDIAIGAVERVTGTSAIIKLFSSP
ncbi:MAG: hypothetical protein HYY60_02710, partial [Parcubacteria group bacterium]|nr:hypothetical protein [Parcubacteria group bacterium]